MRNKFVKWGKTEREIADVLGYCKYLSGVKEFKNSKERFNIGCGDNHILVFTVDEQYYSQLNVCYKNKELCRAYCFRELELMGFEPQSYWHTEHLQLLLRVAIDSGFNAFSILNLLGGTYDNVQ